MKNGIITTSETTHNIQIDRQFIKIAIADRIASIEKIAVPESKIVFTYGSIERNSPTQKIDKLIGAEICFTTHRVE